MTFASPVSRSPVSRRWSFPAAFLAVLVLLVSASLANAANAPRGRWTEAEAAAYMKGQAWPVGGNFLPANAINQLEMWQAATWSPEEIDKEFGWAEAAGMTTMRVFLHDLLWEGDAEGLTKRVDEFLAIAARHKIKPVLVLFDSCWDPQPRLGPQHPPIPGVHNSGWVQGPGRALAEPAEARKMEGYVKGIVGRFAGDQRILAWDLWNEPDNEGGGDYKTNLANKVELVDRYLPQVFAWARSVGPVQPVTSGVWREGDWLHPKAWSATERIQLTESDIISFHNYEWPEGFAKRLDQLEPLHRPILCTEYMARGAGSTFDGSLPIAAKHNVGAINWGFVLGKSQTNLPWDSWKRPYTTEAPTVWFHDVFYPDGRPYRQHEVDEIRSLSQEKAAESR